MNGRVRLNESTKALIEWIVLAAVSGAILLIIF